jgi:hypothetical protein
VDLLLLQLGGQMLCGLLRRHGGGWAGDEVLRAGRGTATQQQQRGGGAPETHEKRAMASRRPGLVRPRAHLRRRIGGPYLGSAVGLHRPIVCSILPRRSLGARVCSGKRAKPAIIPSFFEIIPSCWFLELFVFNEGSFEGPYWNKYMHMTKKRKALIQSKEGL